MLLDGHVHMRGEVAPGRFKAMLAEAGIDAALVVSHHPAGFHVPGAPTNPAERLDKLMALAEGCEGRVYPFYWVDPLEDDALAQVEAAVQRGAMGFKVICNRFHAYEDRPMEVFRAVAAAGKPMLFHSGILWDGAPTSRYNRPGDFEAMLDVPGLRFALAHISWPWVDECIAVYGKFLAARGRRQDLDVEMFIDTTPGTPTIYRREALTKLYTVGYRVEHNVLFGSDGSTEKLTRAADWVDRDRGILTDLGVAPEAVDDYFGGNLRRFLGLVASPE